MKTTAFGVAALGIVMFVFIALVQIVTFNTRATSVQNTLQNAMEASLKTAMDQRSYVIGDEDELIADVIQGLILELDDPRAELDVTVNAADQTLGLLSMKVTAHYPSVTTGEGREGTQVSVERTVILEHVDNDVAAGSHKVVFTTVSGDVIKEYVLAENSQLLPYPNYEPGGGAEFAGWSLDGTSYPNTAEGRAALQALSLDTDYVFVVQEK